MLIDELKEILLYGDTTEYILEQYGGRIEDKTLYINKPIPVQTFYDLRERIKGQQEINNIIIET